MEKKKSSPRSVSSAQVRRFGNSFCYALSSAGRRATLASSGQPDELGWRSRETREGRHGFQHPDSTAETSPGQPPSYTLNDRCAHKGKTRHAEISRPPQSAGMLTFLPLAFRRTSAKLSRTGSSEACVG